MKVLFIIVLLFSSTAFAGHGGLWHDPAGQSQRLGQSVYKAPQGYSGPTTDQAMQREYERQLQRQREREQENRNRQNRYYNPSR